MQRTGFDPTSTDVSVLRRLETFACFAAMMLAITLEAACVYWLGVPGVLHTHSANSLNLVGQWTAATLPQCWLLGALAVLLYRTSAMLVRPKTWDCFEILHNRRAFVRPWRWAVAVGAVQMGALYLDRLTTAVH
jgi:hypothetical protein